MPEVIAGICMQVNVLVIWGGPMIAQHSHLMLQSELQTVNLMLKTAWTEVWIGMIMIMITHGCYT